MTTPAGSITETAFVIQQQTPAPTGQLTFVTPIPNTTTPCKTKSVQSSPMASSRTNSSVSLTEIKASDSVSIAKAPALTQALTFTHLRIAIDPQQDFQTTRREIQKQLSDKPTVYLHTYADIENFWQQAGNKLNPATGFPQTEDGPLQRIIKQGGVVIINESLFSATQLEAFNNAMENQAFNGIKPHENFRVVSLYKNNTPLEQVSGAWFSRLAQMDWQFTESATDDDIFENAINTESRIDLGFDPDWRLRCETHWQPDAQGEWFLVNPLADKPAALTFYNLPDDPHCVDWIQSQGHSTGENKSAPSAKLTLTPSENPTNLTVHLINSQNFSEILGKRSCVIDGKLALKPSLLDIETNTPLYLQISGELNQAQQYALASSKRNIIVVDTLALPPSGQPIITDRQMTIQLTPLDNDNPSQLIGFIKQNEDKSFSYQESDLMQALKDSQQVILSGLNEYTNCQSALSSLLSPAPYAMVNGERVNFKPGQIIVLESAQPAAQNQSTPDAKTTLVDQANAALDQGERVIAFNGPPAGGKSRGMELLIKARNAQRYDLFISEQYSPEFNQRLKAWASNATPGEKFLIIDEYRLGRKNLMNILQGFEKNPPCIRIGHELIVLTHEHKILLASNEKMVGRTAQAWVDQYAYKIHCPPLTDEQLINEIIKPGLTGLSVANDKTFIQQILNQHKAFAEQLPEEQVSPRQLKTLCAWLQHSGKATTIGDIKASTNKNFDELLTEGFQRFYAQALPITHPQYEPPTATIKVTELINTEATQQLAEQINTLLDMQQQPGYQGQRAMLIQGPAARGKDAVIEAVLKQRGEKYQLVNASEGWEVVKTAIQSAQKNGRKLIIAELNQLPSEILEGELNIVLANHDAAPGFALFASANPPNYNREELASALLSRFIVLNIGNYPNTQVRVIVYALAKQNNIAQEKIDALLEYHFELRKKLEMQGINEQYLPTLRQLLACLKGFTTQKEILPEKIQALVYSGYEKLLFQKPAEELPRILRANSNIIAKSNDTAKKSSSRESIQSQQPIQPKRIWLKILGLTLASPILLPVAIVILPIIGLIKLFQSRKVITTAVNLSASTGCSGLGKTPRKNTIGTGPKNSLLASGRLSLDGKLLITPIIKSPATTSPSAGQVSLDTEKVYARLVEGKYQIPLVLPLGKQPICNQENITLKQNTGQWIAESEQAFTGTLTYQLVDDPQETTRQVLQGRNFTAAVFPRFNKLLSQLRKESLNECTKQLKQFFSENFTYKNNYILSLKYGWLKFLGYSRAEIFLKLKQGVCFEIAYTFAEAMNQLNYSVRLVGGQVCDREGKISADGHLWVEIYNDEQQQWISYDPTRWVNYPSAQRINARKINQAPASKTPIKLFSTEIIQHFLQDHPILQQSSITLNANTSNHPTATLDFVKTITRSKMIYKNTQTEVNKKPKHILIAQNPQLSDADFSTWMGLLKGLSEQGFQISIARENSPLKSIKSFSEEEIKAIKQLPGEAAPLSSQHQGKNYYELSPDKALHLCEYLDQLNQKINVRVTNLIKEIQTRPEIQNLPEDIKQKFDLSIWQKILTDFIAEHPAALIDASIEIEKRTEIDEKRLITSILIEKIPSLELDQTFNGIFSQGRYSYIPECKCMSLAEGKITNQNGDIAEGEFTYIPSLKSLALTKGKITYPNGTTTEGTWSYDKSKNDMVFTAKKLT